MSKIAFIGLGVMGYPMAGHLQKGGHDISVYNRTKTKGDEWVKEFGGILAATPKDAALGADFVFSCVGNDSDVRSVLVEPNGALEGMESGSVLVDNTTASATLAVELHKISKDKGIGFIDAPVSGGQAGAENGILTVMCGGDEDIFEKAEPILDCFARQVTLIGPPGSGQLTKMVNQICIAGLVQGLAEGMNFGMKAGLDMEKVIATISKGAAGSWQMENRAETMCRDEYDFGFAVDWMRKDLNIALQEAHSNGARLPVAALVDQLYAAVQSRGGERWDTSSLMHLLKND